MTARKPPAWKLGRKSTCKAGDTVVLEASGNSFAVASRLHALGHTALVLESAQAGKIRDNFCNDDRHSAVKDTTRARSRIRAFLNEHSVRLPKGTKLARQSGLDTALTAREWSELQRELLRQKFTQLWTGEQLRHRCEQIMVRELCAHPEWARLWRLMGVRHRVAFALMALIGDIHRFATAKQLVGYFGLSPRRDQSGNNACGRERGRGRGDVRALLIQSAQNAMNQCGSPLHQWGRKLRVKKTRNLAVAAVARKLTVSIWHLLQGHFTPLTEASEHLQTKLLKLATVLGMQTLANSASQNVTPSLPTKSN